MDVDEGTTPPSSSAAVASEADVDANSNTISSTETGAVVPPSPPRNENEALLLSLEDPELRQEMLLTAPPEFIESLGEEHRLEAERLRAGGQLNVTGTSLGGGVMSQAPGAPDDDGDGDDDNDPY